MLKQILLTSCAFGFTVSALAADITNPFYLPQKNQIGSITSFSFDKNQAKMNSVNFSETSYDKEISEVLQYGITDTLALIAGVGNTFDRTKGTWDVATINQRSDTNVAWNAGLAWNILTGPMRLQLNADYNQVKSYKALYAEMKAGYQFQKFLPYVSVGEELAIDQDVNRPTYNAKIGVYQGACEVWALDTGIRWIHSEYGEQEGYNAEVEASYYLTPKTALSVYGSYLLDGEEKYDGKLYEKSVGVKLRWFF